MRAAQSAILTLAIGLGVARGVGEACGIHCDIRWPNDVLLNGKKCSGILVEMAADDERVRYAVAGVGINVNQAEMPAELADTATSLRIETGCEYVSRGRSRYGFAKQRALYEMFSERGPKPIVSAFSRASSYARGKRVVIETGKEVIVGTTAGLDGAGVLLLKREDGSLEPILAEVFALGMNHLMESRHELLARFSHHVLRPSGGEKGGLAGKLGDRPRSVNTS